LAGSDTAAARSDTALSEPDAIPAKRGWYAKRTSRSRCGVSTVPVIEGIMEPVVLLDAAGRRRSAATLPGHRRSQAPRNKGMRYPADPPSVEEIVLVMRHAGDRPRGLRLRGLIVVLCARGCGSARRSR
jgi:hypothetical protein